MISAYTSFAFIAFASALVLLPLFNRLALGCGWVDAPDARKTHLGTIPLTGGVTIAAAMLLSLIIGDLLWPELARPMFTLLDWPSLPWPKEAAGLLAGLVICFGIGFWDDRFPLRARYRLAAQLVAAACIVVGGTVLTNLGNTFAPIPVGLSLLAVPVTMIAMAGIVNAYTMSDGLDGLCGGYAAVALGAFGVCAALVSASGGAGQRALIEIAPVVLPCLGAVIGFLVYNMRHPWRSHAASFLGDAGSMSLGFLIGWLALRLSSGYGAASLPPVTAVWIVALPLIDMFSCMIRRPLEGLTPMSADRRHIHHLLMAHGLSVRQAVATLHGTAVAFAAIGIIGWRLGLPHWLLFWVLVAAFAGYTMYAVRFWRGQGLPQRPQAAPAAAASPLPGNSAASASVSESRGYST